MMIRVARLFLLVLICPLLRGQQLTFAGLRSVAQQGQINGIQTDAAGDLYLLVNQGDGVRLVETDATASTVLAQSLLGAKGDVGIAVVRDSSGNLYVTGTTTSSSLMATSGAAFANRTDGSTQSFVAKYTPALTNVFVTFTGGSKIAATALAVTADSVFVTGTTYAANLPVTANGIQQTPAAGSSGNGFVERFTATGTTLVYATYLTGANGDTNPAAIVADSADNNYVTGSTSASGFPTVAALVPTMLSNPSGFLTKLTAAGDAIPFSTFIPGAGMTGLAFDSQGQNLLLTGSVALGQFPVAMAQLPLAATPYQTLLRISLDGMTVVNGTVLVPGTTSFVEASPDSGAWVSGSLGSPLFPVAPLAGMGTMFAAHVTGAYSVDQSARFGGLPNQNPTYASSPAIPTSLAVDTTGSALFAGALQPTASASLLASETYDVPLRNAPTTAFPSTPGSAAQTVGTCNGSQCAGSAAYLNELNPTLTGSALSFSAGDVPFVVLRNLGAGAAAGLTVSGASETNNCPATLAAGAECDILLTGNAAGTLTAAAGVDTQSTTFAAYKTPATTIVFFPKELDYGIQTSTSPAGQRTITITNLGTTSQAFTSAAAIAGSFSELSSDCTLNGDVTKKTLEPGGTCHIVVGLTASSNGANDGPLTGQWLIGSRYILLTGFSQAASLSVSATEVDFGTQYVGGLRLPRYLYVSNASVNAVAHAALALPAGSPFTLTDACPSTLAAGSICRIRIDYLGAKSTSSDSAQLSLDQGIMVLLTGQTLPPPGVTGTTVNPNLTVTPTSVTFANAVAVTAASSETQTVTIYNTGAAAFALTLALSGDFTEVTSCPATLPGNSSCAVALTFAPSEPGARSGFLAITAGAGSSPTYVSISGMGSAILPANNGTLGLGSAPVGQPITQYLKVSQPFTTLTAALTGPYTATFVEDNGSGPGQPSASAFSANPSGSCHDCYLALRFTPTVAASQTGTITFSSSSAGMPYALNLTGSGTALNGLVLSPSAQDFGAVAVHSTSGSMLFTLTNLSNNGQSLVLTAPTLSGDYSQAAQTCSGTLAYGSACSVMVSFAPVAIGSRPGTLTIGTATAQLTGTGAADPGIALNPTGLTFANPSTQATVMVSNTGSASVQVGTPTVGTPQFIASSMCGSLAPGASCTITVTYRPGSALVDDSLSIPVGSAVYTVSLAGTYTASSAGLVVSPGVLDFGPEVVLTESSPRNITVTNATAQTQNVSVTIPRQYVLLSPPCTTLAANASCTLTVAFLPLTNGDIPGSLVVQAGSLSTIAYAEGFGQGAGSLTITGGLIVSGTYSFGQVTSGQTAMHTFTATNNTGANLTVRRVTSAPPFLSTTTCGTTLMQGQSCGVSVTYTPLNQVGTGTGSPPATSDAGTLTFESDAASSPDVIHLTAQAGAVTTNSPTNTAPLATFTLSQSSLNFASTTVGDGSAAQTIMFTNTGTVALTVLSLGTTVDFAVSSTCTTVLPAATCTLTIASTPQTAGMHVASLEIASTAATSLEFISLLSSAVSSPLVLSPVSLDFGSDNVGSSATLAVQVTNAGTTPVVFNSLTTSGDYLAGGSCPAMGGTLAAGESCIVQVTFSPAMTGTRTGTLSLSTSASTSPRTISLTGIGIQSRLTATPSALAFGPLVLGASANLTIMFSNSGSAAVMGLQLVASGDYSVTQPCPATLAAGATCNAQITFRPTALGTRNGSLTVSSSDPSSPLSIPLTGTGFAAGSFALTADGPVSVQSGKPATYHLTIAPTGGYTGSVALTCTALAAAQYASCSLSPSTLMLSGANQTAVATINTITSVGGNARVVHPMTSRAEKFVCLLLPGIFLIYKRRRELKRRVPLLLGMIFLCASVLVAGCGSPGGSGDFDARYSPAGSYSYQVTATSTSGVQITQTVTLGLTITAR